MTSYWDHYVRAAMQRYVSWSPRDTPEIHISSVRRTSLVIQQSRSRPPMQPLIIQGSGRCVRGPRGFARGPGGSGRRVTVPVRAVTRT